MMQIEPKRIRFILILFLGLSLITLFLQLVIQSRVQYHVGMGHPVFLGRYSLERICFLTINLSISISIAYLAFFVPLHNLVSRSKEFMIRMAIAFGSLLVSVLVIEFLVRTCPSILPQKILSRRVGWALSDDSYYKYDNELAYIPQPNKVHVYSRNPNDLAMRENFFVPLSGQRLEIICRTDSEGFRNDTDIERADIICIGDSFTMAPDVTTQNIWTNILGEYINKVTKNLGVSGYCPIQEEIVLRRFGINCQPQLVIWAFYEGNDLTEIDGFSKWIQEGRKNVLMNDSRWNAWNREMYSLLILKSFFVDYLKLGLYSDTRSSSDVLFLPVADANLVFTTRTLHIMEQDKQEIADSQSWKVLTDILLRSRSELLKHNAEFLLVVFPMKTNAYISKLLETGLLFKYVKRGYPNITEESALREIENRIKNNCHSITDLTMEFCKENNIHALDLTKSFQRESENSTILFYPLDSHWNPKGHRLVAQEISSYILNNNLVKQ